MLISMPQGSSSVMGAVQAICASAIWDRRSPRHSVMKNDPTCRRGQGRAPFAARSSQKLRDRAGVLSWCSDLPIAGSSLPEAHAIVKHDGRCGGTVRRPRAAAIRGVSQTGQIAGRGSAGHIIRIPSAARGKAGKLTRTSLTCRPRAARQPQKQTISASAWARRSSATKPLMRSEFRKAPTPSPLIWSVRSAVSART